MTIITGKIGDSAGAVASGRLEIRQTVRFDDGSMQVTGAPAQALVVDGLITDANGGEFTLPPSPDGTAVQIREMLGGRSYEWFARVPAVPSVEYRELEPVEPVGHTVYAPPPWLARALAARDETVSARDAAVTAVHEAQGIVDTLGGLGGIRIEVEKAEAAALRSGDEAQRASAEADRARAAAETIDTEAINGRLRGIDTRLDGHDAAFGTVAELLTDQQTQIDARATYQYVNDAVAAVQPAGAAGSPIPQTMAIGLLSAPPGSRLTVPTHVSPAGGQLTHPSVVYFPEPWNGYRYWMAMTPYPGGSDKDEDPNIVASADGLTWVVPQGLTNPLDNAPGSPQYNSDTELVFAQDKLWCFWRYLDTGAGATSERIYVRTSSDGVTWTEKQLVYQANMTSRRLVSPTLVFEGGRWTMWAVDIVASPFKLVRLQSAGASPLLGQWGSPTTCTLPLLSGRDPWHIEIRRFGDSWFGLINDCASGTSGTAGDLYVIRSVDGLTWQRAGAPVVAKAQAGQHDQVYRATFVPEVRNGVLGLRIWYAGWLTGPPSVWNLFWTFAAVSPWQQIGTASFASVPATNGAVPVPVTFPSAFADVPDVKVITDSGRVTTAITTVSATGFTAMLNNWTPAAASAGTLRWVATGYYR